MSRTIPNDILDRIRNENDIVDVVSQYVQLEKKGSNYFGLCPFHDEKTPSFSVTKEKQIFRCFGCGKGGNVITFVQEIESFSFFEAVQFLAERANINLPRRSHSTRSLSTNEKTLLTAFDWLTKYYHHLLKYTAEGEMGRKYLNERGIKDETIDALEFGLAPVNSEVTVQFLQSKNIHLQVLVKSGLLTQTGKDRFHDPFRGRVIFPIKDHLGKVVAFGARSLDASQEPKYLNSREHSLFRKGNFLYNFHLAKNEIRKQKEAILFEGYMDVATAYQAGIKHAVATLGTALTEQQARLLRRYAQSVIVCYDGDDAGLEASYEAASLLKNIGIDVKVASLPQQMDPDTFILTYGGERFKEDVLLASDTFIKFLMNFKKRKYNLALESEKIAYIEDVIADLAKIDHAIEREFYVNELAEQFQLSREVILRDIAKHKNKNKQQAKSKLQPIPPAPTYKPRANRPLPAYRNAERKLLAHMLKDPIVLEKVQQKLGVRFNLDEHKVILTHLYAIYEEKGKIDLSELVDKLEDSSIRQIVTELGFEEPNRSLSDEEINDCIRVILHEAMYMSELQMLREKQRKAKDPRLQAQIGLEIIEMEKKLKH